MVVNANSKQIDVSSVVSTTIKKNGKAYPALKFIFDGAITADNIADLLSGDITIGENKHDGFNTLGEISITVGKITTAEVERETALQTINILSGSSQLTTDEAKEQRNIIEKAIQSLTDEDALGAISLHPCWESLVECGSVESEVGYRFRYGMRLYRCLNANPTFQKDWIPGAGTESLYERIDEEHAGTLEDPIPYEGNMTLHNGKYYTQSSVIYLCHRNTDNPVYNTLAELVGLYVETVSY